LETQAVMVLALGILYLVVGAITVALVLLHSGRGGGLSDMFGGGLERLPPGRPRWSAISIGSPLSWGSSSPS
jgi:hypothetical protein